MRGKEALAAAMAAHRAGRVDEAKGLYRALAEGEPPDYDALSMLGSIALHQRDFPEAARIFALVAGARDGDATAHANLAGVLLALGRTREALDAAERALARKADFPEPLLASGTALLALGRVDEAIVRLERVLVLRPNDADASNKLGVAFHRRARLDDAERALLHAVAARPTFADAFVNLGKVLSAMKRTDDAVFAFERALAIQPANLVARWLLAIARLPVVYRSETELAAVRARYERDLLELRTIHATSAPAVLARAAHGVGVAQPFFLAYQGENDRALQAIYGDLASRFMAALHPDYARPVPAVARAAGERIRVGIVSGFFSRHSVWKIPIRGWIEQLDRASFALFGYHTGDARDDCTDAARASLERLEVGPKSVDEWCATLRADRLDVVIFPEVGMDALSMRLACLRHAPVQCSSLGHPMTSGLPTIDYFLTSALMEPADGDAHYTERLERLPNLSIYYEPMVRTRIEPTRAELGVRDDAVAYWCCQSLYKYLPRHDDVFPRIAREVPGAQFVFLDRNAPVTPVFRARLERAFESFGLRAADHCVFLPALAGDEFDAVIRVMDVFLDGLSWSGFNSTCETIAHDVPIVTTPGRTTRSRHTTAVLTQMGLSDCVSGSVDDYVARAVMLGNDPGERNAMRTRIAANKSRVLRDRTAIDGLEAFLRRVAG